jgi:spore maturation protein CgeB
MSYRFIRVTTNYPQYINDFYQRHPDAQLMSYDDQHKQLVGDSIESASAYVKNLNKIEDVFAAEIITNAPILQETWKKENNVSHHISDKDLAILQIKSFKPDVVWIDDLSLLDQEWKSKLLKEVPSIKLFTGHHCAPSSQKTLEKLKLFDLLFTCTPGLELQFKDNGINSCLMHHGFETSVLEDIQKKNNYEESDFLFTGSLISGAGFHKERIDYLESILKSGIKVSLYGNLEKKSKIVIKKIFYHVIVTLRKLGLKKIIALIPMLRENESFGDTPINFYSTKLLSSTKAPVFGYEMFKVLSKSKICFNIHGEVAGNSAGNIRMFEATGVGTCLVTDWKENIETLFEPGVEIVTYKNKEECIEKIRWLLDNPNERKKIALAGQKRTLENHTILKRAEALNSIILAELNKYTIS